MELPRFCPVCDLVTAAPFCPEHKMATLLTDAPKVDASIVEVGSMIGGRYLVDQCVGKGGFGAVFSAHHTGTGQEVAVKVLNNSGESDVPIRRFFQEARVTSSLRHPNTIRVFDFGQDDTGLLFIAMELLQGRSLKQELKLRRKAGRVFDEVEAVRIGIGVARSLAEAHAANLVHRDLKPDNIYLHQVVDGEEPSVKVLDFGIVKLADSTLTLGSDSGVPGTPSYMSPEQVVKKADLDGRSDLYSLGVVLYQLVTGRVPFKGDNIMQTLYMHVNEQPDPLEQAAKTPISDAYRLLVHRSLSKNPARRPKDAKEMRVALELCIGEVSTGPLSLRVDAEETDVQPVPVSIGPDLADTRELQEPAFFAGDSQASVSVPDLSLTRAAAEKRFSASMVLMIVAVMLFAAVGVTLLVVRVLSPKTVRLETAPAVVTEKVEKPAEVAKSEEPAEVSPKPEVKEPAEKPVTEKPTKKPVTKKAKPPKRRPKVHKPKPTTKKKPKKELEILDEKI